MAIDATVADSLTANQAPAGAKTVKPQIKLTVSGIITDLENGLDRTAIATKYDLSTTEVNEIFKHPKLKGLRPKRKITRIMLIDDTDDNGQATSALVQEDSDASQIQESSSPEVSSEISPDAFSEFEN
jgi:hypothetical protein